MSDALPGGPVGTATPLAPTGAIGSDPKTLGGTMGVPSLTLTVLAFSAPMAVVSGFIPFSIYFGGVGAAFGFVIVTVLLLLFSVGYVTMTRYVPKPGDFYSFISSGLGKMAGLSAAFLSITSYLAMLAGVYAGLGVYIETVITTLGGPDTSWIFWTVVGWAVVTTMGYFHIELSAKVLFVAMVLEVVLVLIYNVAVLVRGGDGGSAGLSLTPLSPTEFFQGNVGVALLFGVLVFLGFESTALFRDEVKTPNKTIPRATFTAVLFVGVLYTLSCYTMTVAYGDQAVAVATDSPATMFPDSIGLYLGSLFTDLTQILLMTSVFAAALSIHNVLARYLHNLGFDNALPSYFGAVHERHASPHRASNLAGVLTAVILLPFIIAGKDGLTLYAMLTGLSAVGVMTLMATVSVAVIVWFARNGFAGRGSWFTVVLAPAVAALGLLGAVVMALTKFNLIVGGDTVWTNMWLVAIPLSGMAVGLVLAVYLKSVRPETYRRLGREDRVVSLSVEN